MITIKIPNRVKIGYKDYDVMIVAGKVIQDNKICYGTIECDLGNINISNESSDDLQKCAFIHECLHGIDEITEAGLTENQVRLIGKGLYSYIKDNPSMFIEE